MPTLAEVTAALDGWYPPATAESWDSVGLTCGRPADEISGVMVAVDCVPATVAEAVGCGAGLLLTHHPLLLSGVHSVAATDPKGILVDRMIRAGIAHFAAHTNADIARHGVSQALADCIGLHDQRPLAPAPSAALDQLTVYVPAENLQSLIDALVEAGAGSVGSYDRCTFAVEGTGTYRPRVGADPFDGEIGVLTSKPEVRLSMVLPRARRAAVVDAMRTAHPYEEVAFELTEQARVAGDTGSGRIGVLAEPMSLAAFTELVAARLPATAGGVRAAGDPDQQIRTVAVCGGAGSSYAELARNAGADAYLSADGKHHSTLEAVAERAVAGAEPPMAIVDAAHWATEWPWLEVVAGLLRARFGDGLAVTVSRTVTDPWTIHRPG